MSTRRPPKLDENYLGLPGDVDDAIYAALVNIVGVQLSHAATEAVCEVLASRRDALADMLLEPVRVFGWQPQMPREA